MVGAELFRGVGECGRRVTPPWGAQHASGGWERGAENAELTSSGAPGERGSWERRIPQSGFIFLVTTWIVYHVGKKTNKKKQQKLKLQPMDVRNGSKINLMKEIETSFVCRNRLIIHHFWGAESQHVVFLHVKVVHEPTHPNYQRFPKQTSYIHPLKTLLSLLHRIYSTVHFLSPPSSCSWSLSFVNRLCTVSPAFKLTSILEMSFKLLSGGQIQQSWASMSVVTPPMIRGPGQTPGPLVPQLTELWANGSLLQSRTASKEQQLSTVFLELPCNPPHVAEEVSQNVCRPRIKKSIMKILMHSSLPTVCFVLREPEQWA